MQIARQKFVHFLRTSTLSVTCMTLLELNVCYYVYNYCTTFNPAIGCHIPIKRIVLLLTVNFCFRTQLSVLGSGTVPLCSIRIPKNGEFSTVRYQCMSNYFLSDTSAHNRPFQCHTDVKTKTGDSNK